MKIKKLACILSLMFIGCANYGYVTKIYTEVAPAPILMGNSDSISYSLQYEKRNQSLVKDTLNGNYMGHAIVTNNNNSVAFIVDKKIRENSYYSLLGEFNQGQAEVAFRAIHQTDIDNLKFQYGALMGLSYSFGFTEYESNFNVGLGPDKIIKDGFDIALRFGVEGHAVYSLFHDRLMLTSSTSAILNGPIGNENMGCVFQSNADVGIAIKYNVTLAIEAGYSFIRFNDFKYNENNRDTYPFIQARFIINQ